MNEQINSKCEIKEIYKEFFWEYYYKLREIINYILQNQYFSDKKMKLNNLKKLLEEGKGIELIRNQHKN